jgi:hypothetical protein
MSFRVWFSGLRGAVAYASANIFPDTTGNKSFIVATTTAVILYTIFVHGGLTIKMCDLLGIETGVDDLAVVAALPKVTSSAAVNWEHKYIYPLVIRGYNDPEFDDKYKPRTEGEYSTIAIIHMYRCMYLADSFLYNNTHFRTAIDDNLGNTMHINKEARERRLEAEHRRMMELRALEAETDLGSVSIHKTGDMGYNKLFGLGADVITVPRAYSSGQVLKNIKVGEDGRIRTLVPEGDESL